VTCLEFDPLLAERAASGEMTPEQAGMLDAHLEGCERCRAEVRAYRDVLDMARLPPDDGRAALEVSTLAAYQRRRRRRVTGLTLGAGFVAAAVAASVLLAPALITLRSLPQPHVVTGDATSIRGVQIGPGGPSLVDASSDEAVAPEDAALAALDEVETP
jgi:anti-sigma factor RsiW